MLRLEMRDLHMDVLANAFEWIVLSITGLMALALAAFIWSDAVADRRRRKAGSASPKAAAAAQDTRQALRRGAKRRLKDDRAAASQAA
jgi:hypothetical protein